MDFRADEVARIRAVGAATGADGQDVLVALLLAFPSVREDSVAFWDGVGAREVVRFGAVCAE